MGGNRRYAILLLLLLPAIASASEVTHTMQRGETLYTLARRYNLSVDQITQYNTISDPTSIPIGAEIRIPGTYVVQRGEYPYSIAQKLDISWVELLEINGLARDAVVRPGDVLLIPDGNAPLVATDTADTTEDPVTETVVETDPVQESTDSTVRSTTTPAPLILGTDGQWPHPGDRTIRDGKFPGTAMAGQYGDPFFAVSAGIVFYVGPFSSFGRLILVRGANGYVYGYAGAERVDVAAGDRIQSGVQLGTLGSSSAFPEPSVLFTVWRNNRYVDPATAPRG